MSERHLSEAEKTLLYISEARERARRAAVAVEKDGGDPRLAGALRAAERALADEHRLLMQRVYFVAPRGDQERLAV